MSTAPPSTSTASTPAKLTTVTGVQLMQGLGVQESKGFWAEAWSTVLKQPRAVLALVWIGIIAFFAIFAPILASGHPLILTRTLPDGSKDVSYPLLESLSAGDILLLLAGVTGILIFAVPFKGVTTSKKIGLLVAAMVQGVAIVAICGIARLYVEGDRPQSVRDFGNSAAFPWIAAGGAGVLTAALASLLPTFASRGSRVLFASLVSVLAGAVVAVNWSTPIERFQYRAAEQAGSATASYTIIPWSPNQRETNWRLLPPGSDPLTPVRLSQVQGELRPMIAAQQAQEQPRFDSVRSEALARALERGLSQDEAESYANLRQIDAIREWRTQTTAQLLPALEQKALEAHPDDGQPSFLLGTDSIGQDVLSNMLHACRLSISIGLVSTGIAVLIGVTIGALMGYFGGWVDLLLYRVVEVFMSVPVLFLLIVAAAVLPRSTYVMMIIIGCVTWTGAARFTRAEFLRLRNQDFVQAAQAVGVPLPSILFKHMLPNGVTPVLVDASFAIAAAIQFEAVLSFLALGPAEQASWGRLLASATNEVGEFKWWLAIFPGLAIFLTALSYNLLGEALRDAIDPKLKKARV